MGVHPCNNRARRYSECQSERVAPLLIILDSFQQILAEDLSVVGELSRCRRHTRNFRGYELLYSDTGTPVNVMDPSSEFEFKSMCRCRGT